jgi:hypothetical protein
MGGAAVVAFDLADRGERLPGDREGERPTAGTGSAGSVVTTACSAELATTRSRGGQGGMSRSRARRRRSWTGHEHRSCYRRGGRSATPARAFTAWCSARRPAAQPVGWAGGPPHRPRRTDGPGSARPQSVSRKPFRLTSRRVAGRVGEPLALRAARWSSSPPSTTRRSAPPASSSARKRPPTRQIRARSTTSSTRTSPTRGSRSGR